MSRLPVTLQINLAPRDLSYARAILPHQLRQLGGAVEEVVLTIDTLGRAREASGPELSELEALAARWSNVAPAVRVQLVDYTPARREELSRRFFQRGLIPNQDYRVGPFYSYFDGWLAATQPFVFHLDSDMLVGGEPRAWMEEAIALLARDPTVFTCTPLAGPPRADLTLSQPSRREAAPHGAHAFDSFSTRIFFVSRERLVAPEPRLPLARAPFRDQLRGWLERASPYDLPERIIAAHMRRLRQRRVDFLGEPPGCWSLHPPFRNQQFFDRLDDLVRRVEAGDVPDAQRGDYNVNDSMIDWSDARAANRWWRRLRRMVVRYGT